MSSRITTLQSSGPPPMPSPFAGMIRKPGAFLCRDGVIFDDLERTIRRHQFQHILPSTMDAAERFLVIQGEPGTGKTVAACDASLRYGFSVALLPAAILASENEGGATAILDDFMRYVVSQSVAFQQRIVVVADDFDLSIAGSDEKTGKTINTNLLNQRLQSFADTGEHRNWDGSGIAIIFTGNDFTRFRASLFRDGRATWFTHAPSHEEKTQIAFHLLRPRTLDERKLVEKLARTYRHESVAFWQSVKNDLNKARLDEIIGLGLPDVDAAEAELAKPRPIDTRRLLAISANRAKTKPLSFL